MHETRFPPAWESLLQGLGWGGAREGQTAPAGFGREETAVRLFLPGSLHRSLHSLSRSGRRRDRLLIQAASGRRALAAADDPAAVARAEHLRTRERSRKAAMGNVEDALSAVQTAEGGLDQIQNVLSRLRELATASASELVTGVSRIAIQTEAAALLSEIDRLASSTDFNGAPLLSTVRLDVGFVIDTSGSMSQELGQVIASVGAMIADFQAAGIDVNFGLAAARRSLDNVDGVDKVVDIGPGDITGALSGLPIAGGAVDPYSALLNTSGADDFNGDGDSFTWRADTASHLIYVTDTNQETALIPGNPTQADVAGQIAAAGVAVHVIARSAQHGAYASLSGLTGGTLFDIGNANGDGVPAALDGITQSMIGTTPSEFGPLVAQVGLDEGADNLLELGLSVDSTRVGLGLTGLSFADAASAGLAITALDAAIDTTNSRRAEIGALTHQLGSELRNHENMFENEVEARSVLEDFDFAAGMADLAREEILQAAGVSMLASMARSQMDAARQMIRTLAQPPPGARFSGRG